MAGPVGRQFRNRDGVLHRAKGYPAVCGGVSAELLATMYPGPLQRPESRRLHLVLMHLNYEWWDNGRFVKGAQVGRRWAPGRPLAFYYPGDHVVFHRALRQEEHTTHTSPLLSSLRRVQYSPEGTTAAAAAAAGAAAAAAVPAGSDDSAGVSACGATDAPAPDAPAGACNGSRKRPRQEPG